MWQLIRPYIRNIYRLFMTMSFFIYDFTRNVKYSGWRGDMNDAELRNYNIAMVYHGLEKSLSYKHRNQNSGWRNAFQIVELLKIAQKNENFGFHDKKAKKVLESFLNLPENLNDERRLKIKESLSTFNFDLFDSEQNYGAFEYSLDDYKKGILENPEDFFFSRYSLREFKDEIVKNEDIQRAVKLAMKTPSVCNRQPWGIYHTSDKEIKDIVLTYQHGNKPFGEHIPNLMVITTDLKAFFSADEHYQHWIDGGLFSMSLMYAFHSLGIATCALNWSAKPKNDLALRKYLNIKPNHTIIMILAVGYPDEKNKVCASPRRPFEEVFYTLEKRN
ncbi:MAG: nitroreductase family protein [Epsilonproteobacteria bacterium]|nr:nitroreductase family protein [Campylobacterota bacterium]